MSTGVVIGLIVVALIVVAGVAFMARSSMQRKRLRSKFGPEYDRALEGKGDRTAAERELAEREREHAKLDLRPLDPGARDTYARNWTAIQEQFVDEPSAAVGQADRLVTDLMAERGYPTEGYEKRVSLLSVEHANTLGHYRDAHEIRQRQDRGEASTEDLRNAMVHYRTLFEDLLGSRQDGERREGAR
ncbi:MULTISPECIES: hypothetical protein [Saccharothrix]|uniref:Secreted protein n=1 Tax=Saccharothrix yanglingensis TaxID=659496 RepID=A0ABU0X310_9PSEU|nr:MULTISPECIES: hypothetical protein [Saccharothrix]MDQ2585674.1 hypothetical protein [Saccharothrix yanglingensis]MDU0291456.1 hypothetical protein [Saccharothrix longispora]